MSFTADCYATVIEPTVDTNIIVTQELYSHGIRIIAHNIFSAYIMAVQ